MKAIAATKTSEMGCSGLLQNWSRPYPLRPVWCSTMGCRRQRTPRSSISASSAACSRWPGAKAAPMVPGPLIWCRHALHCAPRSSVASSCDQTVVARQV